MSKDLTANKGERLDKVESGDEESAGGSGFSGGGGVTTSLKFCGLLIGSQDVGALICWKDRQRN